MKWAGLFALALAAALLMAQSGAPSPTGVPTAPTGRADGSAFLTVDLFLDSGPASLAAWQVEFTPTLAGGRASLVGIEGGEHAEFASPAHYDPAALAPDGGGRVILAAFSTAGVGSLPTGRTRLARLHIFVEGTEKQVGSGDFRVRVHVAADSEGRAIEGAAAQVVAGD